jgi:peptidoglycan/xylan/chitin deacetylase (PgdA/CDA1 family)
VRFSASAAHRTALAAVLLAAVLPAGLSSASVARPTCNGSEASIVGTAGDDVLEGTSGDDVIWGGGGNDTIAAGRGDDLVCGGPGDDVMLGEAGADIILGGDGNDTIAGGPGADVLLGGPGDDTLSGGSGEDRLLGGGGGDVLAGQADADDLSGGPGRDALDGGGGDDALDGGGDDDSLEGGFGEDRCDGGPGRDTAGTCEEVVATEAGQVPEPLFRPGPHQVALTFDDGPAGVNTEQILDILARYDVPATFFVVGGKAAARPDLLRRMAAEGHSVQNHTYSHAWLTRYSDAAIADQLTRANAVVEEATGAVPGCLRPPFGAVSDRVRRVAADLGLATIMWDVDPWDFKRPGAGVVASSVLRATGGGDIVLLHDTAGWSTIGALPAIIEGLRARGYELVPICNTPGIAPRHAGAGSREPASPGSRGPASPR